MTEQFVIHIGKEAVFTALMVAAPALLAGLIVGLTVGIFQAVTQIHEMTLTFIPKILAVLITLVLFMPWMLTKLTDFTRLIFSILPK